MSRTTINDFIDTDGNRRVVITTPYETLSEIQAVIDRAQLHHGERVGWRCVEFRDAINEFQMKVVHSRHAHSPMSSKAVDLSIPSLADFNRARNRERYGEVLKADMPGNEEKGS